MLPVLHRVNTSSKFRWAGHLVLLSSYLFVGTVLRAARGTTTQPHLPIDSVHRLLWAVAMTVTIFAVVCLLAWCCSRSAAAQWRLPWRGGAGPVWRGFFYAIGIRVALFVVAAAGVFFLYILGMINQDSLKSFRPHPENAISMRALAVDPMFRWLAILLLSAMAGTLEEIWRGGMLTGLGGMFPRVFGSRRGQYLAVWPVAAVFGMGHLYMGWAGVIGAAVLGVVLGTLTVWHETVWDAVFTHAFFDAASVFALAWMAVRYPQMFTR